MKSPNDTQKTPKLPLPLASPRPEDDEHATLERTKRSYLILGLAAVALLVGGVGGWAWFTEIAGAVIAPGELRAYENRHSVQHAQGGTVVRMLVEEGSLVAAGQPLLHLYDENLRIERNIMVKRLQETEARTARLLAERDGASGVAKVGGDNPFLEGQRRLFDIRKSLLDAMLDRFDALSVSKRDQIVESQEELRTRVQLYELARENAARIRGLHDTGHATITQINAAAKEAAHLAADISTLKAMIVNLKGELVSLSQQALQLTVERHEEASERLRDLELYKEEVIDNLRLIEQNIAQMVVRAPVGGYVTGLAVHNSGAVVPPGLPIASIVPVNSELIIDAQVDMNAIDQVTLGQTVEILMPTFSQAKTPKVLGEVAYVSADRLVSQSPDGALQMPHYAVQVVLDPRSSDELVVSGLELVSGMPVEIHIQTGMRSPFSYLVKPLMDQINRAFREE